MLKAPGPKTEEYAVKPEVVDEILKKFQIARDDVTDGFSSVEGGNARFSKCIAKEQDALKQPWQSTMWLNPPWSLWPQVAARVVHRECDMVCVAPFWQSKWLTKMMEVAADKMFFAKGAKVFELDGKECPGIRWALVVLLVKKLEAAEDVVAAVKVEGVEDKVSKPPAPGPGKLLEQQSPAVDLEGGLEPQRVGK